jgi:cell division protein ZapE
VPDTRTIAKTVRADAAARGFRLDAGQRRLLAALLEGESVYAWGGPGRGKTWLLDAYFDALPTEAKRRVHFHRFFRELHEKIVINKNAIALALDELLDGIEVLYFDEFFVHDPGDATLLIPLLRRVFESDVVLITSSNFAPDALLPNEEWFAYFEPGVELLLANMTVVELPGRTDYRAVTPRVASGFGSGRWTTAGGLGLTPPTEGEATELVVRGRRFPVRAARDGELWVTFADLAETATATVEYVEWAELFETWIITDVPVFRDMNPEFQKRFVNVIDVLCDMDTRLIVTSPVTRDEFVANAEELPDAFRMTSRLQLLGE